MRRLACALLLALTACGGGDPDPTAPAPPTKPQLTLTIELASCEVGEAANLTLRLANDGGAEASDPPALALVEGGLLLELTHTTAGEERRDRLSIRGLKADGPPLAAGASRQHQLKLPALRAGTYSVRAVASHPRHRGLASARVEWTVRPAGSRRRSELLLDATRGLVRVTLDVDEALPELTALAMVLADQPPRGWRLLPTRDRRSVHLVASGEPAGRAFTFNEDNGDEPELRARRGSLLLGAPRSRAQAQQADSHYARDHLQLILQPAAPAAADANPVIGRVSEGLWVLERLHQTGEPVTLKLAPR